MENGKFCTATAETVLKACENEVEDDFWIANAICINISQNGARRKCFKLAVSERAEGLDLCVERLDARLEVCDRVGEKRYEPDFGPANFVDPADIGTTVTPNPYFPLVPGRQWVYEGGDETITVTVTNKTKLIDGVTCRVVNDVVQDGGEVIEDTDDWYSQDLDGNVWYCGEIARDFETFEGDHPEDAELVSIEGSFKAGRDGDKPGILLLARPQVGDVYRQEVSLGNAEDVAEVLSITGTEMVPVASCTGNCLVTKDFRPLDPGVFENKYYAPGIGLILEVDPETGERVELIEMTP